MIHCEKGYLFRWIIIGQYFVCLLYFTRFPIDTFYSQARLIHFEIRILVWNRGVHVCISKYIYAFVWLLERDYINTRKRANIVADIAAAAADTATATVPFWWQEQNSTQKKAEKNKNINKNNNSVDLAFPIPINNNNTRVKRAAVRLSVNECVNLAQSFAKCDLF